MVRLLFIGSIWMGYRDKHYHKFEISIIGNKPFDLFPENRPWLLICVYRIKKFYIILKFWNLWSFWTNQTWIFLYIFSNTSSSLFKQHFFWYHYIYIYIFFSKKSFLHGMLIQQFKIFRIKNSKDMLNI